MVIIKRVTHFTELEEIKILQSANLKKNLTRLEAELEGFVTAEYSIEFLKALHQAAPSIIATDNNQVIGYALVALKSVGLQHDLLADLFNAVDKTYYRQKPLSASRYVVVGQLCVARNYRGQSLVNRMYQAFKTFLQHEFDYCITDVAKDNPRSLKAHEKTGFSIIDTLEYGGLGWDIVLWDWNA